MRQCLVEVMMREKLRELECDRQTKQLKLWCSDFQKETIKPKPVVSMEIVAKEFIKHFVVISK